MLRGFAVLGIYWINIFIFALPHVGGLIPPELNEESLINSMIGTFGDVYIEGTMRALFSMLFGASALIFLNEARLASSGLDLVDRYFRRTLLLILFGLIHAYLLLWPYDVLYAYGLFGLLLFPMRKLSARALLICGIILLVLGDLDFNAPQLSSNEAESVSKTGFMRLNKASRINHAQALERNQVLQAEMVRVGFNSGVTGDSLEQPTGEESIEIINTGGSIGTYRSDYATIFAFQLKMVTEMQSISIYQNYIFDIGGMMLLGMALFKLGVFTGKFSPRFYLLLAFVGYVAGSVTRFAIINDGSGSGANLLSGYNLGRLLISLGHVGLIGFLCSCYRLNFLTRLVASVGRMALTNYIMQTVISIFLFYGFGFALYAELERFQLSLVCISIWLVQITYSNLWLVCFKQGPLEWLWRSLIYGNLQPNRKNTEIG